MSNTNYDVAFNLSYDYAYRHYIPRYKVAVPYYYMFRSSVAYFSVAISFDSGNESTINYGWIDEFSPPLTQFFYNTDSGQSVKHDLIPDAGVFEKVYLRNPYPDKVTFTSANCRVGVTYATKVPFEVKFNSTGFAANHNPVFKCSTIPKNTYQEYSWSSATVYYKKSSDSTYSSASGTVSGIWSDVTVSTGITLQDGYTYNVYIRAVADDGTVANTPVANFTTTDATAVATCISPVGEFVRGSTSFAWSHSTGYGTPQYAYDLQYSTNNGSTWTTVANHVVTANTRTSSIELSNAGVYLWRVRTYNSNDVVGSWAEATFVNNVPATPPINLSVDSKGRPTVTWVASSQSAYQVQFLLGDTVVYDSGAVYTSQQNHFVNQYFNDERAYVVQVRVYNALGEVSEWAQTGYQQPSVNDVQFIVTEALDGGAEIEVIPDDAFTHYYLLRNNMLIGEITYNSYTDKFAVGQVNYSVVAVTSDDQSDIQTKGIRIKYPRATIITMEGQEIPANKRVNEAYEIQTSNDASINKANFIGDSAPTHYASKMRLKSFAINFFDYQDIGESLIGKVVFYADNFGNGGYCMVTNYEKTDSFIMNSQGINANEVALTLEVTNYDDSVNYPI